MNKVIIENKDGESMIEIKDFNIGFKAALESGDDDPDSFVISLVFKLKNKNDRFSELIRIDNSSIKISK